MHSPQYGQVMQMVRHSRLCGRAIVAYLQSKEFPEVALHFVREPSMRFRLALACGNIDIAMECAFILEKQDGSKRNVWGQLGSEALRQGNHHVVEMSYQRTNDFDRLSFLYLISGDTEKLRKMLKITNIRQDIMGRYHNALLLGDAEERVKVLEVSGHMPLAYVSAKLHGLDEAVDRIKVAIETNGGSVDGLMDKIDTVNKKGGCLLQPPTPIVREINWPTLEVQKTTLEDLEAALADDVVDKDEEKEGNDHAGTCCENNEFDEPTASGSGAIASALDNLNLDDVGKSDWDDDIDLGDDMVEPTATNDVNAMYILSEIEDKGFLMPKSGRPLAALWTTNSHSAIHLAAGAVSSGMQYLNRQIAVSDFSKLRISMVSCFCGTFMIMPGIPGSFSMYVPLLKNDATGYLGSDSLPRTSLRVGQLVNGIRSGYRYFQGGKFNDARAAFTSVLEEIPLVVTENKQEANDVKEMLEICREYITAIRIKGAMSNCALDPVQSTELSAYFTHCNLQPVHLLLALRSAMGIAFKHKNFICAASFARRLLELPDINSERNDNLRVKASKVLQKSEQMARNDHKLNYNENSMFTIDCKDFIPVYCGDKYVKCSYCGSTYMAECMNNNVCLTCGFCTIGVQTIGLVTGS